MENKRIIKFCPDQMPVEEQVYDSLMGLLNPECALNWVEDCFIPGHPCYESYHNMRMAYEDLLDRLGQINEDRDVERMIDHLMAHTRAVGYQMFACGREYERRQKISP